MLLFALESALTGISFGAASAEEVALWQTLALLTKSFLFGIWLCFSLTYSRGNYREFLARSRFLLLAALLLPLCLFPALHAPVIEVLPIRPPAQGWWLQFSGTAKILTRSCSLGRS
jgi:hypothetical protein